MVPRREPSTAPTRTRRWRSWPRRVGAALRTAWLFFRVGSCGLRRHGTPGLVSADRRATEVLHLPKAALALLLGAARLSHPRSRAESSAGARERVGRSDRP